MLILTVRRGDEVFLDDGRIIVSVQYAKGGRVQLGFEASAHVNIVRGNAKLKTRRRGGTDAQSHH